MRNTFLLLVVAGMAVNVKLANAQTAVQQPITGPAPIVLKAKNVAYTQNFPKVAETGEGLQTVGKALTNLPQGWAFAVRTNSKTKDANAWYAPFSGGGLTTATARGVVSCGKTTDRALGAITGGWVTYPQNIKIGAKFINNTGAAITSLQIEYTGEQWRRFITTSAGGGQPDANPSNHPKSKLSFSYKLDDGTLNDGDWIAVAALDFEGPVTEVQGPLNGNDDTNRAKKTFTLTGLNIPNGATFWIRWEKDSAIDGVTNNDCLAIDDFSLIAK